MYFVTSFNFNFFRPQEVIVFIVGGITYEEASTVELFNNKSRREADENAKVKANFGVISSLNQIDDNFKSVVLGGTTILNSDTFLDELKDYQKGHARGRGYDSDDDVE